MCFPDCYNEKFITALIKRSILLGKNCQQMSKNLLYNQKIINRNVNFQSRQCLFQSSHFVDKKTRTAVFLFLVFRYRSYPYTNFGTQSVLIFIFVSTFAQAQVVWYFANAHTNSRNSAQTLCFIVFGTSLSLVPQHKLRHAKRACFYIRFNVCASAS